MIFPLRCIMRCGMNSYALIQFSFKRSNSNLTHVYLNIRYELDRLINKYGDKEDQVAKDLVELLRQHQESLHITPNPAAKLTYEEIMTYHLAFPPFFPDQIPFEDHRVAYQLEFDNSTYLDNLLGLKATDIMGPRARILYERMNDKEEKSVLKRENKSTDAFIDGEHHKLRIFYERMNKKKDDVILNGDNHNKDVFIDEQHRNLNVRKKFDFSKFDEILKQRRLDQMKNAKDLVGL